MALIGNPPIILLDEPSAGMDPIARQFMWRVVSNQRKAQSAVVLTTHSMEETLFLSTKLGIMVRGGIFKCFGTANHIQSKFGTGYEVEIKVRKLKDEEITERASQQQNFKPEDLIRYDQVKALCTNYLLEQDLIDQIHSEGLGAELHKQAMENSNMIPLKSLIVWMHVQ